MALLRFCNIRAQVVDFGVQPEDLVPCGPTRGESPARAAKICLEPSKNAEGVNGGWAGVASDLVLRPWEGLMGDWEGWRCRDFRRHGETRKP